MTQYIEAMFLNEIWKIIFIFYYCSILIPLFISTIFQDRFSHFWFPFKRLKKKKKQPQTKINHKCPFSNIRVQAGFKHFINFFVGSYLDLQSKMTFFFISFSGCIFVCVYLDGPVYATGFTQQSHRLKIFLPVP